jgi:Phosphotransferase enzyme family
VARCVLARYGAADIADAARPEHSASNEVWLAEQVVIRVSRAPDGSLRREAELATILPAEVGYPVVLEVGHNAHVEWMVTERLPGTNIEESWPDLDGTTRSNAIVDLWTRLLAVHQTDAGRARSIGSDSASTPFYALDESEASAMLAWLASEGAIEPDLRDVLADMLDQMFRAIPLVPLVLSHTDAGPHNAVWTGRDAIPLDFEFAAVAPADLDLESMLRTLACLQGPDVSDRLVSQAGGMLAAPGARSRLWGHGSFATCGDCAAGSATSGRMVTSSSGVLRAFATTFTPGGHGCTCAPMRTGPAGWHPVRQTRMAASSVASVLGHIVLHRDDVSRAMRVAHSWRAECRRPSAGCRAGNRPRTAGQHRSAESSPILLRAAGCRGWNGLPGWDLGGG